ncbi:MAG: isoleucine--tRNA ligase, partial [Ignavibacteriae bacterium]|nr:isoleucine--tRNA ligase [Ignavibacteriota bacterium]
RAGTLDLPVNGKQYTIGKEDVEILREDIEGWLVESDGGVTVALDTELTEELMAEGIAREFVNRVQNMRKDAGFEVTDRVTIRFRASTKLSNTLQAMAAYIKNETLAVELSEGSAAGEYSSTIEINGERVEVGVERRSQTHSTSR